MLDAQTRGLDISLATAQGRFILLDADETPATFMAYGKPDPQRFADSVGSVMMQAAAVVSRTPASAQQG